jgi:hypothetical protein
MALFYYLVVGSHPARSRAYFEAELYRYSTSQDRASNTSLWLLVMDISAHLTLPRSPRSSSRISCQMVFISRKAPPFSTSSQILTAG